MTAVPYDCIAARHVKAAIASGLEGDERPKVEKWLNGQRKLTPLLSIPDCSGVTIRVRQPLQEANQRLMDAMGVTVVVDETAPPNVRFGDVISNKGLRLREAEGRR